MSQQITVHNPGPYEVVIDLAGHQLAGFTSAEVRGDERTAAALRSGALVKVKVATKAEAAPKAEPKPEHDEPEPKKTQKKTAVTTNGAGTETGAK